MLASPGFEVLTCAKEFFGRSDAVANVWNGVVIGLVLACFAIYLAGVFAPLLHLLDALS